MPLEGYLVRLVQLIVAPFRDFGHVWLGLVPLYISLLLGELYKSKVSFGHAVGNGFLMLWTGVNWAMHLSNLGFFSYLGSKKDRTLCQVLGHTRFSGYFLITLYPMQVGLVTWNWPSLASVLIFALPAWLFIYLGGRLLRVFMK